MYFILMIVNESDGNQMCTHTFYPFFLNCDNSVLILWSVNAFSENCRELHEN